MKLKLSNEAYDKLCIIVKCIAPILTFISAVLAIWHVPYTAQITATLAALNTCLGGIVTVLKAVYDKQFDNIED